jgi:nitrous oxide reductase accessory protein NosL
MDRVNSKSIDHLSFAIFHLSLSRGLQWQMKNGKWKMKNASLLLVLAVCLFSCCASSRGGAFPAGAAFGSCPVCHMRVKAADDWTSEIYYRDGTKLMFESPADMIAFYTEPRRYDVDASHKDLSRVEKVTVKDYQSRRVIDAGEASFVYNSNVDGPMGPDFIPFGSSEAAEAFLAANSGTLTSFGDVTGDMVREVRK